MHSHVTTVIAELEGVLKDARERGVAGTIPVSEMKLERIIALLRQAEKEGQ